MAATRDVIGMAKGIIMARQNVSEEEAFDILRRASQRMNVKLRELAERVVHPNGRPRAPTRRHPPAGVARVGARPAAMIVSVSTRSSVRPITAEETRPLRHAVLRPGQSFEQTVYSRDDHPETLHLGGFDGDRLVAIASLYREARPHRPTRAAWRLRGMATDPEVRGRGFGHRRPRRGRGPRGRRGRRASCGATPGCRPSASTCGYGFEVDGDEFEIDGIGPHVVVDPDGRAVGLSRVSPAEGAGAAALGSGRWVSRRGGGAPASRRSDCGSASPSVPSTHGR